MRPTLLHFPPLRLRKFARNTIQPAEIRVMTRKIPVEGNGALVPPRDGAPVPPRDRTVVPPPRPHRGSAAPPLVAGPSPLSHGSAGKTCRSEPKTAEKRGIAEIFPAQPSRSACCERRGTCEPRVRRRRKPVDGATRGPTRRLRRLSKNAGGKWRNHHNLATSDGGTKSPRRERTKKPRTSSVRGFRRKS